MTIIIKQADVIPSTILKHKTLTWQPFMVFDQDLQYKSSATVSQQSATSSAFINPFQANSDGVTESSAIFSTSTEYVTVLDVTGTSGILTHVFSAAANNTTTQLIRLTVDGVETLYSHQAFPNYRMVLGGCLAATLPTITSTWNSSASDGDYSDRGLVAGGSEHLMLSPEQTIIEGIGLPFNTSLKVETRTFSVATSSPRAYRAAIYVKQ